MLARNSSRGRKGQRSSSGLETSEPSGALHGRQARPADFVGDIADHRIMPSNRAGITPVWYYGIMAARKMTFSLPQPLAMELLKSVAPRDRSRYVAEALAVKLRVQDEEL